MTTAVREAPHHNNLTCYTDYRCRLPECTARYTAWQQNRLAAIAAGTWQPFIDATPVREHLHKLYASGFTPQRVSVLTGIDWNTVRLYTHSAPRQGRGRIRQTTPDTAAKILAIPVETVLTGRVDPIGTRRRIQALSAIGWPLKELGPHLGLKPDNVRRILARGQKVYGTTAQNAVAAYDTLRTSRPRRHGVSDIGIARALRNARQHKWAPPKYWDQFPGAIDDPHFVPEYGKTRLQVLGEEAHWLAQGGLDRGLIAERLGVDRSYVDKALAAREAVDAR